MPRLGCASFAPAESAIVEDEDGDPAFRELDAHLRAVGEVSGVAVEPDHHRRVCGIRAEPPRVQAHAVVRREEMFGRRDHPAVHIPPARRILVGKEHPCPPKELREREDRDQEDEEEDEDASHDDAVESLRRVRGYGHAVAGDPRRVRELHARNAHPRRSRDRLFRRGTIRGGGVRTIPNVVHRVAAGASRPLSRAAAQRLRADFASHFPAGIALSREVWTVVEEWQG